MGFCVLADCISLNDCYWCTVHMEMWSKKLIDEKMTLQILSLYRSVRVCDVVRDNISLLPFETLQAWSCACFTPGFSAFLRTRTSALHAQCLILVSGQSVILSELIKIIKCAKSATIIYAMHVFTNTVHDTENLTFSEEFCGCSAQTPADSCAERRGSSAGRPRIFHAGRHEFPQIWVKSGGNQKAKFVCSNNARIVKDIARIVWIIIVGLDSLSPVECGCRIRVRFERAIPCNLCKYENAQQISASAYYICRIR